MTEETVTEVASCKHERRDFKISTEDKGRMFLSSLRIVCKDCGKDALITTPQGMQPVGKIVWAWEVPEKAPAKSPPQPPKPPDPSKGLPGTEMLLVTTELGIESKPGCGCRSQAAVMDRLGVERCRARRNELILAIDAGLADWGWMEKLKAASAAAWKAVGMGVSVTDPVRSLVEISLDRAEQKMKETDQ